MLCGNYILSNRSEWTFYFLSSVQFNFTIGDYSKDQKLPEMKNYLDSLIAVNQDSWHLDIEF